MNRPRSVSTSDRIVVGFTGGASAPLGNLWQITAKKTDFYINPVHAPDMFHLSAHGPNQRSGDSHRFHVKVGDQARREVPRGQAGYTSNGYFLAHGVPRRGQPLEGHLIAPRTWLIARIRWTWDMQRPRYRRAAVSGHTWPEINRRESGFVMREALHDNEAADVDVVVSYDRPYWPDEKGARRANAQLGPLRNASGMWLTATMYRRLQLLYPTPDGVLAGRPIGGETPSRIMGCGPGDHDNIYWFVESITSQEIVNANVEEGNVEQGFLGR